MASGDAAASPIRTLVTQLADRSAHGTLLAVCPNSEAVAKAALQAAHEAQAPILFAATLNQVDRDGGYTGWTPAALVDFLKAEASRIGYEGPLHVCLDHGGPWLKDDHVARGLALDTAMAATKRSIEACLDAGYALLHIDGTGHLPEAEAPSPPSVMDRTLKLMAHAETYRRAQHYAPVGYEVGSDEVDGSQADVEAFEQFLSALDTGLADAHLAHAWPCFVVGNVGTDLHTATFAPQVARALAARAAAYGALIKGHYTDYVDAPEDYPLHGMGAANVGPEFAEAEYRALMDLVRLERKLGADAGVPATIRRVVVDSGRWKKWLHPEEPRDAFGALAPSRQQWLLRTGSRYVWTHPDVQAARKRLYDHVSDVARPAAFVEWRIKTAVMKYFHAFNLINLTDRLADARLS